MDTPNPVLLSFVKHLPETSPAKLKVLAGASFREISEQAGEEWKHLAPISGKEEIPEGMVDMGYLEWLKEADAEDRTRMLGWLQMLHELALDLAEEQEEEELEEKMEREQEEGSG